MHGSAASGTPLSGSLAFRKMLLEQKWYFIADEEDVGEGGEPAPKFKSKRGGKGSKKENGGPKQKKARLKQGTLEAGQLDAESDGDGEGAKKQNPAKRPVLDSKVSTTSYFS